MGDKEQCIRDIGLEVLEAKALVGVDWQALSLVVDLGESHFSQSGFLYTNDSCEPFTAISKQRRKLSNLCKRLRDLMSSELSTKISQMLIQIERDNTKLKIEFDDSVNGKWTITPSNIDDIKKQIRPSF